MGVAKVILNNETLIDVTGKTVASSNLLSGFTALGSDGEDVAGSYVPPAVPLYQSKTVTPTTETQVVTPDEGTIKALDNVTDTYDSNDGSTGATVISYPIPGIFTKEFTYARISGTVTGRYRNSSIRITFLCENAVGQLDNSSRYVFANQFEELPSTITITEGASRWGDMVRELRLYRSNNRLYIHIILDGQESYRVMDLSGVTVELSDDPNFGQAYDALSSVTVNPIPSDYVIPAGTLSVLADGTYDVKSYASVDVSVGGGGGGGGSSKKQINFIDYDGTIVESYTKTEWQSVSTLPGNPSHTGLVAQGWNWTKAQIDAQLTAAPDGDVWVGQMYITASGDTEIDVSFPDSARLSPILTIAVNGTITVDWGDNTTPDTVTGSSLTTRKAVPHTYASAGDYTMTIHVASGEFSFYGSAEYTLLRKNTTQNQNRVYSNCVRAIRLGSNITSIGKYAFGYCYSLASITIPSGVTSIENNTFNGCHSLASVTISSSVTSIGDYAFGNCYSLASVTISSSVTSIGDYAFYYCYSLASITIPSGVTSIGDYAFYYCYSLASVTIPSGVTSIGTSTFNTCQSLASVTIPSSVTSIGSQAFASCYSLASITIPSSVTSIGSSAFSSCYSLASITIPSGVTSIENSAFNVCYGIAEYHVEPATPPTLGTTAFANIVSDCKIYVPSASLTDYQAAANWSTYASYMVGE